MSSLMMSESIQTKRKRVIVELVKGKEMATQLQTLLQKPVGEDDGPVLVEDLAVQILRSFTETLSVLSSCAAEPAQIAAVDGGKKAGGRDRRGCYKRRRTGDSWMTILPVVEDSYAWRKYGQKVIMNSEYPRCYFRCTQKYQGCEAIKQVQQINEDPILYQTTYFNHHTCTHTQRAPPATIVDSDLVQLDPLSSETDHPDSRQYHPMIMKEDSKDQHTQSEVVSDAKSSLDPWLEIIGSDSFGYRPTWVPMVSSHQEDGSSACGSSTLHGLDMEVNQLGDIDNLQFDDMY